MALGPVRDYFSTVIHRTSRVYTALKKAVSFCLSHYWRENLRRVQVLQTIVLITVCQPSDA